MDRDKDRSVIEIGKEREINKEREIKTGKETEKEMKMENVLGKR
jgi:hypothetical protein